MTHTPIDTTDEQLVDAMADAVAGVYEGEYFAYGHVQDNQRAALRAALAVIRPIIAAEARASLRALLAEAGEALDRDQTAIKEMLRYLEGGETKGSYDGKPERRRLRFAQSTNEVALASIQSALREIPTSDAKPLDFP